VRKRHQAAASGSGFFVSSDTTPKLKGGSEWCSAFTAELQAAVNGVVSGETPEVLSGAMARDALKLCYAEAKSISSGRLTKVS
jgi:hypothetical protein